MDDFVLEILPDRDLELRVRDDAQIGLEIEAEIIDGGGEPYSGEYDVTPLPRDDVVLPTANRRMSDDVTVRRIPYYETSNPSGGYTAIIG